MEISMKIMEELTLDYFKSFSNQDIDALTKLFDKNIKLKDWNINVSGVDNVISANKDIYKSVDKINVTPKRMYSDGLTTINEIEIEITVNEKKEIINVLDIIEFAKWGKIISINAYKQ
jgi:hypothetical protein